MRIIAGFYKGRRLYTPNDRNIRPTTDKVKEAIFSMIAPNIEDAVAVDLFAGTGNLGLEALSRGAAHCYFGDNSRESINLIKQNIVYCNASNVSTIYAGDYAKVLEKIKQKADVIFLDPPYREGLMLDCLSKITELDLLAEDGIIIAEHGAKEDLPEKIYGLVKQKEKKYGTITISIYS